MNNKLLCSSCCSEIKNEDHYKVEGKIFCVSCYKPNTFKCECCGKRFLDYNNVGDDDIMLCNTCYEREYHSCSCCERIIHNDDTYWSGSYPYCYNCFDEDEESDEDRELDNVHNYGYKPKPLFKKCNSENPELVRYYGVELEIDDGGLDDDNAVDILYEANDDTYSEDHLYIKTDSSLDDGMELVSHPCTILYHRTEFPWKSVINKARSLGYNSHNTGTCGLHIHISKNRLGNDIAAQEAAISRLMYFFESHWNELVKFSRRSEAMLNRWAARYGYKDDPKEILDDAKASSKGRYASVNICNTNTVEIRMFRGTLKYNTFIASLEMIDAICENILMLSDDELRKQSWGDFVLSIDPDFIELIRYLKERQLYINEPVAVDAEV